MTLRWYTDDHVNQAMANMFRDTKLWLVVRRQERQERVDATVKECELCAGLLGAAMFPGMTSMVSQETVWEVIDEHEHYKIKTIYVEMLRLPAHSTLNDCDVGEIQVVPDVDQVFTATMPGTYNLALYNADTLLFCTELGLMETGSTIDSLGVFFTMGAA